MSTATIMLLNGNLMSAFYITTDAVSLANELIQKIEYTKAASIEVPNLAGEAAAEEMFDLTNNPSRQDERVLKYGRGRSVSLGDIVQVDGEKFLCESAGWTKL